MRRSSTRFGLLRVRGVPATAGLSSSPMRERWCMLQRRRRSSLPVRWRGRRGSLSTPAPSASPLAGLTQWCTWGTGCGAARCSAYQRQRCMWACAVAMTTSIRRDGSPPLAIEHGWCPTMAHLGDQRRGDPRADHGAARDSGVLTTVSDRCVQSIASRECPIPGCRTNWCVHKKQPPVHLRSLRRPGWLGNRRTGDTHGCDQHAPDD